MKSYLLLAIIFLSFSSISQEEKANNLYMRLGIYELSLGYQRAISDFVDLGVEFDYRPQFKPSNYHNLQWSSWSSAMSGFRIKPMINYHCCERGYWSFLLSYRFLEADRLIYDPGKFSGANTSDYAEYSQTNQEIGIGAIFNRPFTYHPAFEWYFGAGLQTKFVRRQYTIEGSYTSQFPSDRLEHTNYLSPMIYFGIKLNFLRF